MPLSPYYLEVVMNSGVACLAVVVMNSWGSLQVFLVSFTKGPGGFTYVFIITPFISTLVPINGTTLVDDRVFVLGGDQKAFDGPATFEVGLNAIPLTDLLDTFTETLCVGYDNMTLIFNFISERLGSCSALVVGFFSCFIL